MDKIEIINSIACLLVSAEDNAKHLNTAFHAMKYGDFNTAHAYLYKTDYSEDAKMRRAALEALKVIVNQQEPKRKEQE